jgi:alpha-L-fucosidase
VQIKQRNRGYGMFIHFGVNTFNDLEWSKGDLPVSSYNPTELDCDQWIRVAKEAGFRYVILITKHHDGFCLWDSQYTEYDVGSSPVKTDVVAEVAKACEKYGLRFGIYYSLWDRNHPSHDDPDPKVYQDYMLRQLEELMTGYGPVCELWFDGGWAKQDEDWNIPELYRRVREWQPDCSISVNHTIHCPTDSKKIRLPSVMEKGDPIRYWPVDVRLKDPDIARWDDPQLYSLDGELKRLPFEHTVCIAARWNWFQKTEALPARELDELEQLFYWCTRDDSTLIVNLPPDQRGLICEHEAQRAIALAERLGIRGGGPLPTGPENLLFKAKVTDCSSNAEQAWKAVDYDLASAWEAGDNTGMLEITPAEPITIDQVVLHEKSVNKRVSDNDSFSEIRTFDVQEFRLEFKQDGKWIIQHMGTLIGHARRIDFPEKITCEALRLVITKSTAPPRIQHIGAALRSTAGLRPVYELPEK